ncbi:MAG: hypothetical protein H0W33_02790 [Gammaproteobacteria bacterium]|nr:hypothetical protein [Gammaproteobacteria bacterium]
MSHQTPGGLAGRRVFFSPTGMRRVPELGEMKMAPRNARFLTTLFLLISAPPLVYAVRQYLHQDYAGMCLSLFIGFCAAGAAAEPEFLTRKVSQAFAIRSSASGEFEEVTSRNALGDLFMTIGLISLLGWIVLTIF